MHCFIISYCTFLPILRAPLMSNSCQKYYTQTNLACSSCYSAKVKWQYATYMQFTSLSVACAVYPWKNTRPPGSARSVFIVMSLLSLKHNIPLWPSSMRGNVLDAQKRCDQEHKCIRCGSNHRCTLSAKQIFCSCLSVGFIALLNLLLSRQAWAY